MKRSLQNIGNIIAEPSAAFSQLKSESRWGMALVVFYLFSVLIGWAILPYIETLADASLANTDLQPEQLEAAKNMAQIMTNIGIFIYPVFGILWFIISGALLRLAARIFAKNDTLKFKHIYAAVIHISLISCVIQLVNAALLLVFGDVGNVKSAVDLKMVPGLHMLFDSSLSVKLLLFLSHINPLSLWVIAVMAIAISVFVDVDKNKARVTAIILWLLYILPEVVFAS